MDGGIPDAVAGEAPDYVRRLKTAGAQSAWRPIGIMGQNVFWGKSFDSCEQPDYLGLVTR